MQLASAGYYIFFFFAILHDRRESIGLIRFFSLHILYRPGGSVFVVSYPCRLVPGSVG